MDKQLSFGAKALNSNSSKKKNGGPPNRMNDMNYSDWMKFQKSFFRYQSDQELVEGFIHFFTKSIWENGKPSNSRIIGVGNFNNEKIEPPRIVENIVPENLEDLISVIDDEDSYDFVLVDLRDHISDVASLDLFIENYSDKFSKLLRKTLVEGRYACILAEMQNIDGGGFPIPWSISLSLRNHLRLRDEKIRLI